MMNNNKILTVSYGTFSCTLEGFDDSFGTMKAIAEYFRDLAADDRYFGAEPPQPDAEMLARIAEREVSRRVHAREQDGKIFLSALDDAQTPDAPVSAAPVAAAVTAAPDALDAPVAPQADAAAQAPVAPVQSTDAKIETASVEALSTDALIDDVIDAEAEAAEAVEIEESVSEIETQEAEVEEAAAEADAPASLVAEAQNDLDEDENDIVPGQPDAEVEAFFADADPAPEETAIEEPSVDMGPGAAIAAPEEIASEEAPALDSIAAKLQRIRAVVAQHEEVEVEDDYLEDEHAEASSPAEASDIVAEARADIEDALDEDDAQSDNLAEDDNDDVTAILNRLQGTPVDTVAEAMEDAESDEAEGKDAAEGSEDTVSNLFEEDEEGFEATAEDEASDQTEDTHETAEEAPAAQPPAHPRARVIKVKRADLEAAIQKGDLEEYDDDEDVASQEDSTADKADAEPALDDLAPARSAETSLSPEDEADLARELAELEADIMAENEAQAADTSDDADAAEADDTADAVAEADEDEAEADDNAPEPKASAARAKLPSIDDEDSSDVNRLLAETDHQMDEPEGATRRDAFAHLRAAVAAKKADSTIEEPTEKGAGAYRADLAEVVRPRRPVSSEARTQRPEDARPAPLKLVAEQRIDVEQPKAAGPVRPRRVATVVDNASSDDAESFADFAAEMGASTLPQLLEAAAAYLSFVEGRKQFSRPQLMTKVRQAGGDEGFSREEGLRSFGQLLRAGKIEKIKGGRFAASEDIGFRPDQRAAG